VEAIAGKIMGKYRESTINLGLIMGKYRENPP
jgi:hypothetical protein